MVASNPRSSNACETCRRRKVKCSGEQPCDACVKHGWECAFGRTGRRRYSEAHVQRLLERIQSYEERYGTDCNGCSASPPVAPVDNPHRPPPQPGPVTLGYNAASDQPQESIPYEDSVTGISPATDLTSGPAFESQVRFLLDLSKPCPSPASVIYSSQRIPCGSRAQWASVRTLLNHTDEPPIPSLEASQQLLDQFLFYLGVSKHFFDSRSFSDSMVLLFQTPESREQQKRTSWFTEYLLVMAMAKLMDVEPSSCQPPGSDLFAEARPISNGAIASMMLIFIKLLANWAGIAPRHRAGM
ncbi:Zn(II)2Cys6 transcription factor domain-containing protein [Aspergillus chevalieri]|uniref:Zn(2)-C6 fungal-type domain-containing protein n=1 Tax=Aspergillus chevalieri TaxID=182096 RepID=A0A7R7VWN1_ASPCH|nr:uncharacterized protein ACHE_70352A [Aspergillus chevalieri]BCR91509.1 hypothetical protein ACHE_70352A [Aspergillus chevalieri]